MAHMQFLGTLVGRALTDNRTANLPFCFQNRVNEVGLKWNKPLIWNTYAADRVILRIGGFIVFYVIYGLLRCLPVWQHIYSTNIYLATSHICLWHSHNIFCSILQNADQGVINLESNFIALLFQSLILPNMHQGL